MFSVSKSRTFETFLQLQFAAMVVRNLENKLRGFRNVFANRIRYGKTGEQVNFNSKYNKIVRLYNNYVRYVLFHK